MVIVIFEKKKSLNNALQDFIITRIDFDDDSKEIVSFCVLQIYVESETAHEVIKFDTAHGFCHVHRFYWRLDHRGERLVGKDISQESFNECRDDIKENWKKYKQWYLAK